MSVKHYYRLTYKCDGEGIYRSDYLSTFQKSSEQAYKLIAALAVNHITPCEEKNSYTYEMIDNKENYRFYFTNNISNKILKTLIALSKFEQIQFDLYFENELEIVWRGDSGIQVLGKVRR